MPGKPINLEQLRVQFRRGQFEAATNHATAQALDRAAKTGEPLTQTHSDTALTDDRQASAAVGIYVGFLNSGTVRPCRHISDNSPRPEWWSSAIPTARWCGQAGCDQAGVYVQLAHRRLLPAACVSCGQRRPDAIVRLRVTVANTELLIHLCESCEAS